MLIQPQGHSAAGRIMSMKNSNDSIENRTRDLCKVLRFKTCGYIHLLPIYAFEVYTGTTVSSCINITHYHHVLKVFSRYRPYCYWLYHLVLLPARGTLLVAQLVEALRYKSKGRSIPDGVTGIFH